MQDLAGRRQLRPLSRLDVELWRGGKRIGVLARLRDVLPGRYAFGLTGRGPRGARSPRGAYRCASSPCRRTGGPRPSVGFRIR